MKRIPKRYRNQAIYNQKPVSPLLGMAFKWNSRIWTVTGIEGKTVKINSGSINSQIDLLMLPKVAQLLPAGPQAA